MDIATQLFDRSRGQQCPISARGAFIETDFTFEAVGIAERPEHDIEPRNVAVVICMDAPLVMDRMALGSGD